MKHALGAIILLSCTKLALGTPGTRTRTSPTRRENHTPRPVSHRACDLDWFLGT